MSPWKVWYLNTPNWICSRHCHFRQLDYYLQNQGTFYQYYWYLLNFVWHDVNEGIFKPFHDKYHLHFLSFLYTILIHAMPYFGVRFGSPLHQFRQIFWDFYQYIKALNYISMVYMIHWIIDNIFQPYQQMSSIKVAWD